MIRRTWVAVAVAVASLAAAVYLFVDNRRLSKRVDELKAAAPVAQASQPAGASDPWAVQPKAQDGPERQDVKAGLGAIDGSGPKLAEEQKETRLERRVRRQEELAAFLGRLEGETEEEYRQRMLPMMEMFLGPRRDQIADLRREVEEKAGVTEEQRQKLDQAFEQVYDDVLTYTNAAIADGQLTPYERNVAGMLEYAGGLGGILNGAQGTIGTILSPEQMQTIYGSGFEWAEYLGLSAPWEKLTPPPPPPGGS